MILYRIARELVYQLDRSHQQERLATMLSTIQMFVVLYTGETREEVLVHWKKLTDAGHDLVEAYRRSMELYRSEGQSDEAVADALKKVGNLFELQSYWPAAEEMMRELLDVALRLNDRVNEGWAHRLLGGLARWQGQYEEAMEELEHALTIAQSVGDRLMEASAIGNMGIVYYNRGEYDQAMECYERSRAICEELGNRSGMSGILGNMGNVYDSRGEHDRAMECYGWQRAICEELGDRHGLSMVIGNMGIVYYNRGEYNLALECYERSRTVSEELGDRYGLSMVIGNMGNLYYNRGEYDQAMECYERQRVIYEEIGNRPRLSYAIGNMGIVYADRGEYNRGLECLRTALEGHRAIGVLPGVIDCLAGIADVVLEVVLLEQEPSEYVMSYVGATTNWREAALVLAREHADECLKLSEQLSKPDTLFTARVLLARIDAAEGKTVAAVEQLNGMLAEASDDEQQAELQYWLWSLTPVPSPIGRGVAEDRRDVNGSEALRLYKQLLAKTPKHEFKQRIEELTTGGITA